MLLFVIPSSYPNHLNSQASIFVHEQCVALKKAGHKIVVLDATSHGWKNWFDKSCFKTYQHEKDGITIYSRHIQAALKSIFFQLATMQFRIVIKKLFELAVKEHGLPDLIYAHFTYPSGYVSCELSKKYQVPLMVLEHGGIFMQPKVPQYLKKIATQTIEHSDLFACVSEAQRKCLYHCSKSKKEIKIINNMIDDKFTYYPLNNEKTFTFFSAGNLYKVKRMDFLIEAFVKAFSSEENVCLKIAGDGKERQYLEALIKKNNREHQVILLGRLNRDEMLKEYINCNVFTLVSEHESFGIAYREAMAVGRPVISSDNGGISVGWKDEYGKIVALHDMEGLMGAMRSVYENYETYDLKAISEACIHNYSAKSVVEKVTNEMQKIVGDDQ